MGPTGWLKKLLTTVNEHREREIPGREIQFTIERVNRKNQPNLINCVTDDFISDEAMATTKIARCVLRWSSKLFHSKKIARQFRSICQFYCLSSAQEMAFGRENKRLQQKGNCRFWFVPLKSSTVRNQIWLFLSGPHFSYSVVELRRVTRKDVIKGVARCYVTCIEGKHFY